MTTADRSAATPASLRTAQRGRGASAPARKPHRGRGTIGYLLAAPYVLFLLCLGIIPTLYAVYLSVVDGSGSFIGAWNFANVLSDYRFLPALVHVASFLAIWLPFMILMVLLISFLLQARPGKFSTSMRVLYYLPGAFTGSASVLIWVFILSPGVGPFSFVYSLFGVEYTSDLVTTDRLPVLFTLMAFTAGAGSWIVIMYGAINAVPEEIIEAAHVDGANRWNIATRIQLPLIRKYVVYMLVLCVAGGLQIYTEPQLLNPIFSVGDSAVSTKTTWSINQLALTLGISEGNVGEAAALSLMIMLVGLLVAVVLVLWTDFFDTKETRE